MNDVFDVNSDVKDLVGTFCQNNRKGFEEFLESFQASKAKQEENLKALINSSTTIKANDIKGILFPDNFKFDVFVSHSHSDEDYAKKLSFYLLNRFNVTFFIDSMYWENIQNLLDLMDSPNINKDTKLYNLYKIRRSCQKGYILLGEALTETINKSIAVFFSKHFKFGCS
jgi:hypothetical protein